MTLSPNAREGIERLRPSWCPIPAMPLTLRLGDPLSSLRIPGSGSPAGPTAPPGRWSARARRDERIRERRSQYLCKIDASGIASVFTVLLFILMAPGYVVVDRSSAVDLVRAQHIRPLLGARREDAMSVSLARDGRLYFNDLRIVYADLPEQIREGLRRGAEKRVYILVDERARYADVRRVLYELRLAGIERISFPTNPFHR